MSIKWIIGAVIPVVIVAVLALAPRLSLKESLLFVNLIPSISRETS